MRVRFAPSPTGYLHIGGLRTALYNYLMARKAGGEFVLRIEDTDRSRFVEDAEDDLVAALAWTGIVADEGPAAPGAVGPYRQSERSYQEAIDQLLADGRAYRAFDTPEEIEAMRQAHISDTNPNPRYDMTTRGGMRNSLTLSEDDVLRLLADGAPHVVRLKVDPGQDIVFEDLVRGRVAFRSDTIDDQVLLKSDGLPTYHLANVVDDASMGITHVVRGEEWLPSTPKHALLYDALGLTMPTMAHLPLILSPTGGKLSKRKAEKQGIPVLVRDYQAAGFEPEAVVNYLAMLGWNPGDEREVFALEELVEAFSIERVGSAGTRFDMDKLRWFNQQHLMRLEPWELARRIRPVLEAAGIEPGADLEAVCTLMRERVVTLQDVAAEWAYFFEDPETYDERGVKKRWKADSPDLLARYADRLKLAVSFDAASIEAALRSVTDDAEVGAGRLIHPARLAVSGVTAGPGLFELMELLGKETCLRRIRSALERLPNAG